MLGDAPLSVGLVAVQLLGVYWFGVALKRQLKKRGTPGFRPTRIEQWEWRGLIAIGFGVLFASFFFWSTLWAWPRWLTEMLKYATLTAAGAVVWCSAVQGWLEGASSR